MSQYISGNQRTFTAGAALTKYTRVKLSSGLLVAAGVGASDDTLEIGTILDASFASGDVRPVHLRSAAGTTKMIAAAAISAGVAVYGAASGQISTTVSGSPIGISLEAATAANDVIEVLRY